MRPNLLGAMGLPASLSVERLPDRSVSARGGKEVTGQQAGEVGKIFRRHAVS